MYLYLLECNLSFCSKETLKCSESEKEEGI